MRKVHVLLTKEELSLDKLASGKKIAVVLDILLATTTIVSALEHGATEVIPVLNPEEAIHVSSRFEKGKVLLAGELQAKPIDGFFYPGPVEINRIIRGRALVLSTTNGTVALRKAACANKVYISSLLNNAAVAEAALQEDQDHTIVIICSGNSGQFSLEDFYGAGHFIANLTCRTHEEIELNDAGKAALDFYTRYSSDQMEILGKSKVGQLLIDLGFKENLILAGTSTCSIVPVLKDNQVVLTVAKEG